MAINFPNNPTSGQIHIVDNITYVYDATGGKWDLSDQVATLNDFSNVGTDLVPGQTDTYDLGTAARRWKDLHLSGNTIYIGDASITAGNGVVNLPSGSTVGGTNIGSSGGGSGGVEILADMAALIAKTGMNAGDQAFVTSNNTLYIYISTGWYKIATVENLSPTSITGVATSYALETDGTPTVITATSSDPEGFPLTWSYAVTSGSLGTTATVSQADNVFTITPGTSDPADEGTFELTFSVTDGTNSAVSTASTFTLQFVVSRYTIDTTATASGTKTLTSVSITPPPNFTGNTDCRGIHFGDSGTKLYLLRTTGVANDRGHIIQYDLTTPYDITTASFHSQHQFAPLANNNVRGFTMSRNGDYCFIACGTSGVTALQLSNPWMFSSATVWYSHQLTTTYMADIEISQDGTKVLFEIDGVFRTGTLSTPYDLRTSTTDPGTFDNNAFDTNPLSFQFDPTGTKLTYLQNQTTLAVATFASSWTLTATPVSLVTYTLSGGGPGLSEFDIGPDIIIGDSYADNTWVAYTIAGITTE